MKTFDQIAAGHKFLASAILTASNKAFGQPQPREKVMQEIRDHVDCALAHYESAFQTEEEAKDEVQPLVFHGDVLQPGELSVTLGDGLLTPQQYRAVLGVLNSNPQVREPLLTAIATEETPNSASSPA